MTNGQRPSSTSTKEDRPVHEDNDCHRRPATHSLSNDPKTASPLHDDGLTEASPPVPGFLRPTSYSAVFTEGRSHLSIWNKKLNVEVDIRDWQPSKLPSWDFGKVEEGAKILSLLADLSRYEPALSRWCEVQCLATITIYIRQCIVLIPPEIKESRGQSNSLVPLSHKVFLRTSTPCSLDTKISLRDYPSFLMGENIWWEIVGLMITILGLSAILMHEVNAYDESDSQTNWKDLTQESVRAGDQCIAFCEQFGHLKDIGVTLILMNFVLHTQVYGDAGECAGAQLILRTDFTLLDYHCWRKSGGRADRYMAQLFCG